MKLVVRCGTLRQNMSSDFTKTVAAEPRRRLSRLRESASVSWQHENNAVLMRVVHMHASRKVCQYWQYLPTTCTLSNVRATLSPVRSNSLYATLGSTSIFAQHIKIESRSLKHRCRLALITHNAHTFLLHVEDPVSGPDRRVIFFFQRQEKRGQQQKPLGVANLASHERTPTCKCSFPSSRCVAGEVPNNLNDSINTAEESLAGETKTQEHRRSNVS